MLSKWIYILISDNERVKTTFQKELLKILCDENDDTKLYFEKEYKINHPYALKNSKKLFLGNSNQENKKSDICILSSNLNKDDIKDMINLGKRQFYNIGGIFFDKDEEIVLLDWDEKFIINNEFNNEESQIKLSARKFTQVLINRMIIQ